MLKMMAGNAILITMANALNFSSTDYQRNDKSMHGRNQDRKNGQKDSRRRGQWKGQIEGQMERTDRTDGKYR